MLGLGLCMSVHAAPPSSQSAIMDDMTACSLGNAELCNRAGITLTSLGRYREALSCYEHSCNFNSGAGCSWLAYMYANGNGGADKDLEKAKKLYKKACTLQYGQACYSLGELYENDEKVEYKLSEILELYEKSCTLGYSFGCSSLGYMYAHGTEKSPPEPRTAAFFYAKACDLLDGLGCVNAGLIYADKDEKKKADYEKSAEYYRKACNLFVGSGCSNLGYYYEVGLGVAQDGNMAVFNYERGCELDEILGCYNAALLYEKGEIVQLDVTRLFDLN